MRILLLSLACVLATCATAEAAPLNSRDLPKEAKWVVHIDYDAFNSSDFADKIRTQKPEMAVKARDWMEQNLGINPQEDLHGLTLFSDAYKPHSGAAVLHARYNRKRLEPNIESKPGVKTTKWEGHTLYTWDAPQKKHGKHKKHADDDSCSKCGCKDDSCSECGCKDDSGNDKKQNKKTVSVLLLDRNTIIAACSEKEVKSVAKLLNDEAPSLKGVDSKLTKKAPKGAFFYGAAVELDKISQYEGVFPILQQHKRIVWSFGENGKEMFEKVALVGEDEQVANRMKKVVQGFVSLAQVWAGDAQQLAQLYEKNIEINQDGNIVRVDWHGDTEEVIAGLQELEARTHQWREARRKAKQQ